MLPWKTLGVAQKEGFHFLQSFCKSEDIFDGKWFWGCISPQRERKTGRKEKELTPVRMGKINKTGNHKCWRGCGERKTLLHCGWECELVQPLWKAVWWFFKVLKIDLPYDPVLHCWRFTPKIQMQ